MKSEVEYSGLSESEVLASRERYGENILTPPARTPMWKLFLEKFSDPIIRILLVALLLSVAVAVYHIATVCRRCSNRQVSLWLYCWRRLSAFFSK